MQHAVLMRAQELKAEALQAPDPGENGEPGLPVLLLAVLFGFLLIVLLLALLRGVK